MRTSMTININRITSCTNQYIRRYSRKSKKDLNTTLEKLKSENFVSLSQLKIGQTLSNIQYYKDFPEPILQPDELYPEWIWEPILYPPKPAAFIPSENIQTRKQLRTMNQFYMKCNNIDASSKKF